jgi:hypothetical protein
MKIRILNALLVLISAVSLSGCLSVKSYVDPGLPSAGAESVVPIASPAPIQVLYEFRNKGAANAKATELTNARVLQVVKQSKLFSEVSAVPVAGQRRLTITVDNVPITSEGDAKAKGFGTGLTFGLVGSMVTDGYVCEATYSAEGGAPVKFNFRHAMHTTIGNASGPAGLTGLSPQEAVYAMLDQLTWSILRDLSKSGRL